MHLEDLFRLLLGLEKLLAMLRILHHVLICSLVEDHVVLVLATVALMIDLKLARAAWHVLRVLLILLERGMHLLLLLLLKLLVLLVL